MNALERPPATLASPAVEWSKPRRGGGETAAAYGFLAPNGIGFLAFTLIPIVASFVLSLFDWPLLSSPSYVGLQNYRDLATKDPVFGQVLLNTVSFVVGYVPFNLLLSLGIAVWLSSKIRARNLFRIVFFLPVVTPMVANAMIWTLLYAPNTGVIDWFIATIFHVPGPNWLGSQNLAMPAMVAMSLWQGFGYNMLIFSAGLQVIPRDLYEAAALDGASAWRRFLNITLPLLTPFIFFGLVLTLITSFQVFTQPYILTGGGPGVSTTTLVLYLYNNGFQYFRMGYASALAWILFLIIMAITIVQFVAQRRWVHYE
ncbi:MAG TPA: sugar ABC transporter permease [Thermomicrobiales bacterium]|nr:sugar ABC transporter permease [Thermomicrobiales bacterium]